MLKILLRKRVNKEILDTLKIKSVLGQAWTATLHF